MGGVLEELYARGLLHAVDQQARDGVHDAVARIDKHEAVCAQRYAAIEAANVTFAKTLEAIGTTIGKRLDAGAGRFRRIEIVQWGLVASIAAAALFGENPFADRILEFGVKIAAKFAGL